MAKHVSLSCVVRFNPGTFHCSDSAFIDSVFISGVNYHQEICSGKRNHSKCVYIVALDCSLRENKKKA